MKVSDNFVHDYVTNTFTIMLQTSSHTSYKQDVKYVVWQHQT